MNTSTKNKIYYFKNSIAKRLAIYILLFSSLITLLGTSFQLYLYYSEDINFIKDSMSQIKTTRLPSIITSLWVSDSEYIETELTSILELPDMQFIQIIKDEKELYSFGNPQTGNIISQDFSLDYPFKGKIIHLGTLHVVASLNGVYQRLYDKMLVILMTQGIKTFLVSFFILFLFYHLVGKHLLVMATYAQTLNLGHLDSPLVISRGGKKRDVADELSTVASAINSMRTNLKQDINARHKIEEELKKSYALLDAIIEGATDAIFLKDLEGHYLLANKATLQAIGKSKEEVIGKNDAQLFPQKSAQVISEADSRVIESGETYLSEERLESTDGDTIWLSNKSPFRDKNNTVIGLLGISRNITELKQSDEEKWNLKEQLRQAQKMEAIGTLAGGIAHDFNNILSIIFGNVDLAKECAPTDSKISHNLNQILAAGHRAKDLVQQILTFSRQAQVEKIPLKMNQVINESLKMLRSSFPASIEIQENISGDCGTIHADPTQLHQVLMNLCTNAFHSMEKKGGILRVTLQIADSIPLELQEKKTKTGNSFIKLSISDTGQGIGPDIIDKIFDPFFTTKDPGKGTGMGLAISYGIIKDYGGTITVDSQLGNGTTFHVYLPQSILETVPTPSEEAVSEGRERILFVDDEELLTAMYKDMLKSLGYHVTTKQGSHEALKTFQNQPDNFDLVITDQTMPDMTGIDLARNILQIRPDIPIILCTGYSSLVNEDVAKAQGIKAFAMKPLTRNSIAKLIRKVLDAS